MLSWLLQWHRALSVSSQAQGTPQPLVPRLEGRGSPHLPGYTTLSPSTGVPRAARTPPPAPAAPQLSSAVLIFNPSCLPHGGRWARWPRFPGTCGSHAGTGHPFLERAGAGGAHEPPLPTGSPHGSCPSWEPSAGSWGARGAGRGCGAGGRHRPLWPGGVRDVPLAPVQTAAAAARECPGRRDPGLKANRRRAGGWEKGRKPLSLCPLPPRHSGARGERAAESPRGLAGIPQPAGRKRSQTPTQTGPSGG